MRHCLASACTALLLPALCMAQAIDAEPLAPSGHMASAAGLPLNDGALSPGTLTVRVVRGGFAGNLSGRDVVLDVLGAQTRRARTNADGRAEFTDVPVGAHVRASVVVDGDRLESAVFPVPIDSGVRLLLATPQVGGDPVTERSGDVHEASPVAPLVSSRGPAPADDGRVMAFLLGISALVFAAVIMRRSTSSRPSSAADIARPESSSRPGTRVQ